MVWKGEQASVQAGAGIVADSDAADEELEMPEQGEGALDRGRRGAAPDPARAPMTVPNSDDGATSSTARRAGWWS